MFNCILESLYPSVCPFCGKINADGICDFCRKKISYIKEPRCMKCGKPLQNEEQEYCYDCSRFEYAFEQGRSLWVHHQPVSGAIYQFKFHNKRCYAEVFAEELAKEYHSWVRQINPDVMIPVPLHKTKKRKRGYNQAELLAEVFAEKLNEIDKECSIPVLKKVVFRMKKTRPQKLLNDIERQENLKGAFGVRAAWRPVRTVLIIDDIYTTGATIQRITKILKKTGVQKVYFLTISIGQGL